MLVCYLCTTSLNDDDGYVVLMFNQLNLFQYTPVKKSIVM